MNLKDLIFLVFGIFFGILGIVIIIGFIIDIYEWIKKNKGE